MSNVRELIKTRGWWQVVVHPGRFDKHHIERTTDLLPIVQRCVVSLRGWDFPHLDGRARVSAGSDWIEQETDWQHYLEHWRFYTSGQFVHRAGMYNDWRDRSDIWSPNEGWRPNSGMPLISTAYRIAEIFEFAARLALTPAGDTTMHVAITIEGLADRQLYEENSGIPTIFSTGPLIATSPSFRSERDYDRAELIANSHALAVEMTRELLLVFGWNGPAEVVRGWQDELFAHMATPAR